MRALSQHTYTAAFSRQVWSQGARALAGNSKTQKSRSTVSLHCKFSSKVTFLSLSSERNVENSNVLSKIKALSSGDGWQVSKMQKNIDSQLATKFAMETTCGADF